MTHSSIVLNPLRQKIAVILSLIYGASFCFLVQVTLFAYVEVACGMIGDNFSPEKCDEIFKVSNTVWWLTWKHTTGFYVVVLAAAYYNLGGRSNLPLLKVSAFILAIVGVGNVPMHHISTATGELAWGPERMVFNYIWASVSIVIFYLACTVKEKPAE